MKLKTNAAVLCVISASLVLGILAGAFLIGSASGGDPDSVLSLPDKRDAEGIRQFILDRNRNTVFESVIIFLSAFTVASPLICSPVLLFRGAALGYAAAGLHSSASIAGFIVYAAVTALIVTLALFSCAGSEDKRNNTLRFTASHTASFLMICGASIIINTAPDLILQRFK